MTVEEKATCVLCGEPMPEGEQMFKYHGYSGPCPNPALPKKTEQPVGSTGGYSISRNEDGYEILTLHPIGEHDEGELWIRYDTHQSLLKRESSNHELLTEIASIAAMEYSLGATPSGIKSIYELLENAGWLAKEINRIEDQEPV